MAMGSAVALFGARFARTGRGGWWLVGASAIAVMFKFAFIFIIGLVAIALLIQAIVALRRGQPWRGGVLSPARLIAFPVAAAVGAFAVEATWLVIRSLTAVGPGPDQGVSSQITVYSLVRSLFVFLAPPPVSDGSGFVQLMLYPLSILTVVGVIGWFFSQRVWGMARNWSIATVLSAIVFAPLLLVGLQLLLHSTAPIEQRYALVLMPMFFIAAASLIRNSIAQWIVLAYGVALISLTLLRILPF